MTTSLSSTQAREQAILHSARLLAPTNRAELRQWCRLYLDLELPDRPLCPHHQTPLDYLEYAFFEQGPSPDTVVWACRGGGKTMIGAAATLLDLLFKPAIQIRILGGSEEQSRKMYAYLCDRIADRFDDLLAAPPTRRGFRLTNGSRVEILTQSQRSVRGTRVQKMRCDEVELFDPEVWSAAQLTTRSLLADEGQERAEAGRQGATVSRARGAVEVFSTLHKPSGLMSHLVKPAPGINRKLFTWCLWDVIGPCLPHVRSCDPCVLFPDCRGRARRASGFLPVADVLAIHERSSRQSWESEMLCLAPYPENQVFPAFHVSTHVNTYPSGAAEPGHRVNLRGRELLVESLVAGVDYGWQVFACVWVVLLRDAEGRRMVWVVDEYVVPERDLAGHALAIKGRAAWGGMGGVGEVWKPAVVYGDVAGRQHDAHSGRTSEGVLKAAGLVMKSRAMRVMEGVEALRRLMDPPEGWGRKEPVPRLMVDGRCEKVVAALTNYVQKDGVPVKDGEHDHVVDAVRYAVAGEGVGGKVEVRAY